MLVQQDVVPLRENGHGHVFACTAELFDGEIDSDSLLRLLAQAAGAPGLFGSGRVCVLYGYGSRPASLYRELRNLDGIDMIWDRDFGPWWLIPLRLIAASHGGLMQVTDRNALAIAFEPLAYLAMVELYSFRASLLPDVTRYVRKAGWRSFIETVIGAQDESYFCMGVDGDSRGSERNYFGWASFGKECPDDLKQVVHASTPR